MYVVLRLGKIAGDQTNDFVTIGISALSVFVFVGAAFVLAKFQCNWERNSELLFVRAFPGAGKDIAV